MVHVCYMVYVCYMVHVCYMVYHMSLRAGSPDIHAYGI